MIALALLYLKWLAIGAVGTFLILPFYVVAKKAAQEKRIPAEISLLVMALLFIGAIFDVLILNITASLLLLDIPYRRVNGPREYSFSQHLKRLVLDRGWRGSFSRWIARTFILWIDPEHLD